MVEFNGIRGDSSPQNHKPKFAIDDFLNSVYRCSRLATFYLCYKTFRYKRLEGSPLFNRPYDYYYFLYTKNPSN